jgi:precorrin-6A synthase
VAPSLPAMREVLLIGMGAGDPSFMTVGAIDALRRLDVLFLLEKRDEQRDLVALREEIVARFAGERPPRLVAAQDPPRERGADAAQQRAAVAAWREQRVALVERLLAEELGEDEVGGFLAWGDPTLYESLLSVLDTVGDRGTVPFRTDVVPGISAVSALAARHQVPLNRVGAAVQVTTGRRLASEGWPEGVDDVVVMLDAGATFTKVAPDGIDIYWGAYLGTEDEILMSGPLSECAEPIRTAREAAAERKGWIFDIYLLRRCAS